MHVPNIFISIFLATVCLVSATENEKRAPSGFTGVRGKKSIREGAYEDVLINEDEDTNLANKRTPSGFMGMRGKKPFEGWIQEQQELPGIKRVPSGFHGMRGKKQSDSDDTYGKRAPNGFMGMRGKKDYDLTDRNYGILEKRAPAGFLGMRGKKDNEIMGDLKRTQNPGFFGMRGKKQAARSAGFFGMRGKKYPYEFRGKFVGVRGKKVSNEINGPDYYTNEELARLGEGLDINQLMLLLTDNGSIEQANVDNGQLFQN